jgi:DNA topoisomerase III
MGKTLVIAEKPSVGRDLAAALPDGFRQSKDKTHLEGDEYVITWAVGHLVGLAQPEEYDPKLKKWRFADLPIVPERFKLVPNDERAKKQLSAVHKLLRSSEIDAVVNACDAGREGELIFAYVFETADVDKPVRRLWLSSMTKRAIQDAFASLRDGGEMKPLELAARSRNEADWIVGMNATRAASIRLRSAFDGAVSLGRVQTPTLALVVRRELEIRDFEPEPYWLVEASFVADPTRRYDGRYLGGRRLPEDEASAVVRDVEGGRGEITKLEKKEERERPQLLYDLTTLQRHANTLHGFSARRTLAAAQRLYEEHKALTYPRTNSRFLTSDMVEDIRPTAELVGHNAMYRRGAQYVLGLKELPLERVVNDAKVEDHHAIIPTKAEHDLAKLDDDERRVYDLVAKRFLAIFHPDAVYERTRVETTVAERIFRTSGRLLLEAGWKAVYGEEAHEPGQNGAGPGEDDGGGDQLLPRLERGEEVDVARVESIRKETQPPRRFTDASLLGAMETAGKEIDDAEMREAMKERGIGTPATRAAIIERLIDVGYLEREGRALRATEKGVQVIGLLGEHPLTSPQLTGDWERRLGLIEHGGDSREAFMRDIAKFTTDTVQELDKLKDVKIERANLGPCPVCGRDVRENRKGYSCWSREDPGCGFVIWKKKASKILPPAVVKELMASLKESIERGDEPPVGRTKAPVTGFRGRSGRSFRAKLRVERTDEGKWRVEFDEEWAKEPPPEAHEGGDAAPAEAAADAAAAAAGDGTQPGDTRPDKADPEGGRVGAAATADGGNGAAPEPAVRDR